MSPSTGRFRATYSAVSDDTIDAPDSTSSAIVMLCVASRMNPTTAGPTKPARFPTELIQAIPAAAATPERSEVGSDQNSDIVHMIPMVANVSATNPAMPGIPGIAEMLNATACSKPASAMCQRRSPVLSEWWPTTIMTIAEAPQGITDSQPMVSGSLVRVSLMTCGSEKPSPSLPSTNPKYTRH